MYKIYSVLKGILPAINGCGSYVYHKFIPASTQFIVTEAMSHDIKAVLSSKMNIAYNTQWPENTPIHLQDGIRFAFSSTATAMVNTIVDQQVIEFNSQSFLLHRIKNFYDDVISSSKLTSFLIEMINPFSDYSLIDRAFFFASGVLAVSLPNLVSNSANILGTGFCELISKDHYMECKNYTDNISFWTYPSTIALSTIGMIEVAHFIAD